MTPACPMRQIVVPLGAGTLSGASAAEAIRPLVGLATNSPFADADTCASGVVAPLTMTESVTTPGFIFVRAGGGVAEMPDGALAGTGACPEDWAASGLRGALGVAEPVTARAAIRPL